MSDQWCNHYNGLNNEKCRNGVRYAEIRPALRELDSYRCLNPKAKMQCLGHELRTQEEIDRNNQYAADYLIKSNLLWTRDGDECPVCGQKVTSGKQIGRCVYASCGCRMGQGKLHKNWLQESEGD